MKMERKLRQFNDKKLKCWEHISIDVWHIVQSIFRQVVFGISLKSEEREKKDNQTIVFL